MLALCVIYIMVRYLVGLFVFFCHTTDAFPSFHNPQLLTSRQQVKTTSVFLHAERKYPLVVVGTASEAVAAAMALCTREEILKGLLNNDSERPPSPPPQLVSLLKLPHRYQIEMSKDTDNLLQQSLLLGQYDGSSIPTVDDYQTTFSNVEQFLSCIYDCNEEYGKPIIHTSTETRADKLSVLADNSVRNSVSYIGLNLYSNLVQSDHEKFMLPKEEAVDLGERLQKFLEKGSEGSCAISMDLPTHLAMLQANRLPKSRGVLGTTDIFAIRDDIEEGKNVDNGKSMTMEYHYNYDNPMGGTDPLLCPSYGNCIVSPNTINHPVVQFEANSAYSAAYTAMRGYGMDPTSSLCVASSIKAIFKELGRFENDDSVYSTKFSPPAYEWDVIDRIVDFYGQSRLSVVQVEGSSRKKYREFGYK